VPLSLNILYQYNITACEIPSFTPAYFNFDFTVEQDDILPIRSGVPVVIVITLVFTEYNALYRMLLRKTPYIA
jgi:hypothetical protein